MSEKTQLTTFNNIIEVVLQHEGGYVNDPNDLGGETKYGITKRFYPSVDIKNLTKGEAKKIYHTDYWRRAKCDEVPPQLRHIYFDGCVNVGIGRSIKILQRAAKNKGEDIEVDGKIGPNTLKAIFDLEVDRVRAFRIKYYVDLIIDKPNQERFYYGWVKRVLEI